MAGDTRVSAAYVTVLADRTDAPVRVSAAYVVVLASAGVTSVTYDDTITDNGASTDTVAGADAISASAGVDAGTTSDTVAGAGVLSVSAGSDAGVGTDVVAGAATIDQDLSDASATTDDVGGQSVLAAALSDTSSSDDGVGGGQDVFSAAEDSAASADEVVGGRVYARTISDSRPARDNLPRITGTRTRQGATVDTVNPDIGITVLAQVAVVATISEATAAGDSVSAGAETVSVSAQDSAGVGDVVVQTLVHAPAVSDEANGQDAGSVVATFVANAGNSSATSDDLELDGNSIYRTLISDAQASSDDAAVLAAAVAATDDATSGVDEVTALGVWASTLSEGATAGDTTAGDLAAPGMIADALTPADVMTAELVAAANLADTALAAGYFADNARFRRRVVWIS